MVSSSNSKKAVADSSKRWLDLPRDVMFTIFQKLGAIEVLTNAQGVCSVDYSSGNLLDISIEYFANDDLLRYIADSASHLRRLRLVYCYNVTDEGLCEVAKNLPQLEELDISMNNLSKKSLEAIGRYCPQLKSIKFNM